MRGGGAIIRNNKGIKRGLVGEEARCVDMSAYGVEEFRRILSLQLNRHWRCFVFAEYECGVSWGIQSLFIEIAPGTGTLFLVVQIRIAYRKE